MEAAPPLITEQRGRANIFAWCLLFAVIVAAGVLFFFNPSGNRYYPQCFFRTLTGWDCPGCGGLRATHQLLHGHLREAFALNPLFVISLPLIVWFAVRYFFRRLTGRKLPELFKNTTWVWIGGMMVVAFGILRNLPWSAWLNG